MTKFKYLYIYLRIYIFSDHESRSNSHQTEEQNVEGETENTPLLQRFPQNVQAERNSSMIVIVSLLLLIALAGVTIGIYLLIIQDNSGM